MRPLSIVPAKVKQLAQVVFVNGYTREVHASILESLRTQHLNMVFQPIVNHTKQSIFAHESLSRPVYKNTPIRPDIWFTTAHEYDHSIKTDLLAVRSAMTQSQINERNTSEQLLFVNVMPNSLLSEAFKTELESMFQLSLCSPDRLVLEVTEHISYEPSVIAAALSSYRELGIRFALDDVGLGASNISSIVELEPDFIKLDRALINGISSSPSKQKMVAQLVEFMGSGELVIAEGIENIDDLTSVQETGVHLSQGYYWGKPQSFSLMPIADHLFNNTEQSPLGNETSSSVVQLKNKRNGCVKVKNGRILVTDPKELGRFATIEIPPDPRVRIIINGELATGRVLIQENDEIVVETTDMEPTSYLFVRETPDKMAVNAVRQITPGEKYYLKDNDDALSHLVLEFITQPIYPDPLTFESIVELLNTSGYQGIHDTNAIDALCKATETIEVTVLRGISPIPGIPDRYLETDHPRSYDPLHKRMKTDTVTAGTTVAMLIKGTQGIPGSNIFGQPISPPALPPRRVLGSGVSQIGDMLVALRNGRLHIDKDKIDVIPELVIGHDLTAKDGNVDFDGDVIVYGSVLDGVHIQSSGSITVRGSVMCSTLMGERGVFISGSIVGSQVVAGQSVFLYQEVESVLRRCTIEYGRFREEHHTLLQHAQQHDTSNYKLYMIASILIEQRHPTLLDTFKQLANDFHDLSSIDTLFSELVHELRTKWLVLQRTKIHEQDIEQLYTQLIDFRNKAQTIASGKKTEIRANNVTSSNLRATGKIIINGSGVYTSTLESLDSVLVKGHMRGGFIITRHVARINELGTTSGTETAVQVTDENGFIAITTRYTNTLLQVGKKRDRNFSTQKNVTYRRQTND